MLLAVWGVGALFVAAQPDRVSMDSALGFVRASAVAALLACPFLIGALLVVRVSHWLQLYVWDRFGFPFPLFFLRTRRHREVAAKDRDRVEEPDPGTED